MGGIYMFGNNENKEKRFKVVSDQSSRLLGITVVQDTETGVNYIIAQGVESLGITPLLDREGKPLVTPVD
jgi:hypothetical protein